MGRKAINRQEYIESRGKRVACYNKRHEGLLRKAAEL